MTDQEVNEDLQAAVRLKETEMMCRMRDEAHAASQAANATYEDDIAAEARAAAQEDAARRASAQ